MVQKYGDHQSVSKTPGQHWRWHKMDNADQVLQQSAALGETDKPEDRTHAQGRAPVAVAPMSSSGGQDGHVGVVVVPGVRGVVGPKIGENDVGEASA